MRAVEVVEAGGPETLRTVEVDPPAPGPGEVLIEVAAAGVNRADLLQRQGRYPPPPGASPRLGLECSGRVVEVGPPDEHGAPRWSAGDRVCALLPGGGYAELVTAHSSLVLPAPLGMTLEDAAALPEAAATVYSNLFAEPLLHPGESLLVHGAAGGVGVFAVQAARELGVGPILATARAEQAEELAELGVHTTIDYREQDFLAAARRRTADRGVDVILDNMGAAYLKRNLAALARDGRIAVIGLQGGRRAELDLSALLAKRARIGGAGLRSRPLPQRADIMAGVGRRHWEAVSQGRIRPIVAQSFGLEEAAAAHRRLEAGGVFGKLLLRP